MMPLPRWRAPGPVPPECLLLPFWRTPFVRALVAATSLSAAAHAGFYLSFAAPTVAEIAACAALAASSAALCVVYWTRLSTCYVRRVPEMQLPTLGFVAAVVVWAFAAAYATLWKCDGSLFGGATLHLHRVPVAVDMLYLSATNMLGPGLGDIFGASALVRAMIVLQTLCRLVFIVFAFAKAMEYAGSEEDLSGRGLYGPWCVLRRAFLRCSLLMAVGYLMTHLIASWTVVPETVFLIAFALCVSALFCGYLYWLGIDGGIRRRDFHVVRLALVFLLVASEFAFAYATMRKYDPTLFTIAAPGATPLRALWDMFYFSVTNMDPGPALADVAPASVRARVVMIMQMMHVPALAMFAAAKVGDLIACRKGAAGQRTWVVPPPADRAGRPAVYNQRLAFA
jgi:hypothetical protein